MLRLSGIGLCLFVLASCGRGPQAYLEKGNNLIAAGQVADAVINYKKAIQKNPRFGEAYYRLALADLNQQQPAEAYQSLMQAISLLPDRDDIKIRLADLCLQGYVRDARRPRNLYEQVERISRNLLAKDPNSYDGLRLAAYLALLDKRISNALDAFTRANLARPRQPEVVAALGQLLIENGRIVEAEAFARGIVAEDRDFSVANDLLYAILMSTQRVDEAGQLVQARVDHAPNQSYNLLLLARHYALVGKPDAMRSTLQRLIAAPEAFPDARLQIGDFYRRIGAVEEARRQYEEGARLAGNTQKRVYQKRLAGALISLGRSAEALGLVESILKESPKDEDALRGEAELLLRRRGPGDVASAVAALESLAANKPDDGLLHYRLGTAYQLKGNVDAATRQLEEAAKRAPDAISPRLALARLSIEAKKFEKALRQLDEILARNPGIPEVQVLRASVLAEMQQFDRARSELRALLRDKPSYTEAQLQMAFVDLADKQFQRAEAGFLSLYRPGQPDPRPVIGLSRSYAAQNQPEKAAAVLKDELRRSPDHAAVRFALADLSVLTKDYKAALHEYKQIAAGSPDSAGLQLRIGFAYQLTGDVEGAKSSFENAARLAPEADQPVAALAALLEAEGKREEARVQFQRLLSLRPDDPKALNDLAFLTAETGGSLDEALKLAQKAFQKDPSNPHVSDTLGYIYLTRNQNDAAQQIFAKLVTRYPEDPTYRLHLAMALLKRGEKSSARQELARALAGKPDRSRESEIKDLMATIR